MALIHLPASQHRTQPWKNGRGISTTIADHPVAADFDNVLWQVGGTGIPQDSPFSLLPQLDRIFTVIEGAGVELTCVDEDGTTRIARVEPLQPYAFRGDWKTECRLLDGPVKVLNTMARRGKYTASVDFPPDTLLGGTEGETLIAVDTTTLSAWMLPEGTAGEIALPPGNCAAVSIRSCRA